MQKNITPEIITSLKPNEIFVFGSNLAGTHGGGAAAMAHKQFGAKWGLASGMQGQSYALPTMDKNIRPLALYNIQTHVNVFTSFAKYSPEYSFYVTAIGCGICGYTAEEIAPFFAEANKLDNIYLPISFLNILNN